MLIMSEINNIRKKYFEEGMSISSINKVTGKDRKTIKKYIDKTDWNDEIPKATDEPKFKKLEPYKVTIDSWLIDDKKAKRKQRHTAKRIYDRLVEIHKNDFDSSYRAVAGYVSVRKKEIFGKKSGHLPLEHIAGEAQADFGDADYYENGKLYSGKYLNLSFPHSNIGYFQLFKGENQECLFEGLINIFNHIGGVPSVIWFDNTSTIVKKILKDNKRSLTDAFIRFKEHYGFDTNFCNVNSGHEKGNVEAKVGYHRRNMLVPVPRFNSLVDFNKELLLKCDTDAKREHYRKNATIEELFALDKTELGPLPNNFLDVSKYITLKTNEYGRFYLNSGLHEYSVSPKYANTKMLIKLTANEVIPLDDSHREIVKHERFYGNQKQQSMKWLPYLTQLSRCPGALKYSGIYHILPDSVKNYLDKSEKNSRGQLLKMIAELTKQSSFDCAVNTVSKALEYPAINTDNLLSIHNRLNGVYIKLPPLKKSDNIPVLTSLESVLKNYDKGLSALKEVAHANN